MKNQYNGSWLTILKNSGAKLNGLQSFVIMPYRGISYGKAVTPANDFNGTISHYLHVVRNQNAPFPAILYPSADTYLVFCRDNDEYHRSFFVGPRSLPRLGEYVTDNTEYFVVGLSQAGSYAFLPMDQNELTDKSFPLNDIFPKWAPGLTQKINGAAGFDAKVTAFERFLGGYFDKLRFMENDSAKEITRLSVAGDYSQYTKHIKSLNYTERHRRRLFLKYTGVAPKKFLQIIRGQSALKMMSAQPKRPLTEIAYNLDYYDQAHFINEFKSLYETTPLQFVKDFLSHNKNDLTEADCKPKTTN